MGKILTVLRAEIVQVNGQLALARQAFDHADNNPRRQSILASQIADLCLELELLERLLTKLSSNEVGHE
jgi:hypothetical protein